MLVKERRLRKAAEIKLARLRHQHQATSRRPDRPPAPRAAPRPSGPLACALRPRNSARSPSGSWPTRPPRSRCWTCPGLSATGVSRFGQPDRHGEQARGRGAYRRTDRGRPAGTRCGAGKVVLQFSGDTVLTRQLSKSDTVRARIGHEVLAVSQLDDLRGVIRPIRPRRSSRGELAIPEVDIDQVTPAGDRDIPE